MDLDKYSVKRTIHTGVKTAVFMRIFLFTTKVKLSKNN